MTLKSLALAACLTATAGMGFADGHAKLKVGMITTLSGGGAGLGIDVRDGFMLAMKQAGDTGIEVVIEDDQRKPDIAVQLADKMIQSEKVDVLTGIIWSNLAMAVVPAATAQGKFYLSPNAGPSALAGKGCHPNYFNVAWQNDNLHEAAGAYANTADYKNSFILAPNYPAGKDALTGYKRQYSGCVIGRIVHKAWPNRLRRRNRPNSRIRGRFRVFPSCRVAWVFHSSSNTPTAASTFPSLVPAFSFDQGILQSRWTGRIGCGEHIPVEQGHRQRHKTRHSSRPFKRNTDACRLSMQARGLIPPICSSLPRPRPMWAMPTPSAPH